MLTNIFFTLILLIGFLTGRTDFAQKQIKNQHLIIIASAGLLVHIFAFLTQKIIPTLQLLSLGTAVAIGIFFFLQNVWRGGDAKLFILLSALMPATGYEAILPLPCLMLFANTFIIGLILIIPDLVHSIRRKRKRLLLQMITSFLSSLLLLKHPSFLKGRSI